MSRRAEIEALLAHFRYEHLPDHLAVISKRFHLLACHMDAVCEDNYELIVCLRKLLEAKDCAVRSILQGDVV